MHWFIKLIIVALLLVAIGNLALALRQMLSTHSKAGNRPHMSHFIGRRLIFSASIVILLLLLAATGQISFNPRPF
ncbi:DUF2909 domain-containing protein [Neiella marina]|uniref:DUF2909 domain-containing protein n=1 Tax=Neiella holothuriorum TaxID=2870530 RepID=A0ABS7EFV5_9GAMM|nr:DUF2909 family protein [Neiella holothuriorum]MBW8191237.1 DUF2909 domain-containing protein [Neiella holothuriorum]